MHSISVSYDSDHFITSDEVSVRLWDINDSSQCFDVVNIEPKKIEELLEVITHCEYHPTDSSTFLYSSSKGYFEVCDLRVSSDSKTFPTRYNSVENDDGKIEQFSEIVNSVCWASFSKT